MVVVVVVVLVVMSMMLLLLMMLSQGLLVSFELLEDGQPHCTEADLEGQLRVVRQEGDEHVLGEGLHRDGLGVDPEAEARGRAHLERESDLVAEDADQGGVEVDVHDLGEEALLLLDGLLLGVEAGRHDSLLPEGDQGRLEGQAQVGLVTGRPHGHMLVPDLVVMVAMVVAFAAAAITSGRRT